MTEDITYSMVFNRIIIVIDRSTCSIEFIPIEVKVPSKISLLNSIYVYRTAKLLLYSHSTES